MSMLRLLSLLSILSLSTSTASLSPAGLFSSLLFSALPAAPRNGLKLGGIRLLRVGVYLCTRRDGCTALHSSTLLSTDPHR